MQKNHSTIEDLVRNTKVPERSASYWQEFPKEVIRRIAQLEHVPAVVRRNECRTSSMAWLLPVGLATACLAIGFMIGFWSGGGRARSMDVLARYDKVYRETVRMFPHQVSAIVMKQGDAQLVLTDHANVPTSQPLVLKVTISGQTQHIITFSGQQVRLNGESCEVMTDANGNVILVGKGWCWSSQDARKKVGHYKFEAQPLETAL